MDEKVEPQKDSVAKVPRRRWEESDLRPILLTSMPDHFPAKMVHGYLPSSEINHWHLLYNLTLATLKVIV